MAASDLLSSPVFRPLHERSFALSSSPTPELHESLATHSRAPSLRSGSAAVPVPLGATTTFTSASELLRAAQAAGDDSPSITNEPKSHTARGVKARNNPTSKTGTKVTKQTKTSKTPKRVAKEVIILSSDDVAPETPKVAPDTGASGEKKGITSRDQSTDTVEPKTKPWETIQTSQSPAQALAWEEACPSKPPTKTKPRRKADKPEIVSRHFAKDISEESVPPVRITTSKRPRAPTPEPIILEPAVQRRMDWTPPRPDPTNMLSEPLDASTGMLEEDDRVTERGASHLFKHLRDKYGHMESKDGATALDKPRAVQTLSKRKAIELVSVNEASLTAEANRNPSPAKEKAQKKKPRTITEVAMAAYQVKIPDTAQNAAKDKSFLDHFKLHEPDDASNTSKGKTVKVTKKGKKPTAKQPELLSPQTALRQSAAQDFVFGTSSQLAREQSPTFLKELNAALRASNMTSDNGSSADSSTSGGVPARTPGRGLWSVSARDEVGDLVDVEVINLVDSPPSALQSDAILDPWKDLPPPDPAATEPDRADMSLIEIGSHTNPTAERIVSQPQLSRPTLSNTPNRITINSVASASPEPLDSSYIPIEELLADEMPPPSNQQQSLEEADQAANPAKSGDCASSRPKYELFTDAKLSKEISRYGFKVVKSRTAMISLLDQCWQSNNKAPGVGALFSTTSAATAPRPKKDTTEAEPTSASASRKKRPLPRSKKSLTTGTTNDTESNVAPPAKRPRGRPKKVVATDHDDDGTQYFPVNKESDQEAKPVTPKKRGRSRKDETRTAHAATPSPKTKDSPKSKASGRPPIEIKDSDLDSDDETGEFASPNQLFSPGQGEVSITDDTEITLDLDPSAAQSSLFSLITRAVTSAPRTTDPANPSWHEKILMYDPIILEDLTMWLNSGQLTRVGHDGEIAPGEVKKWCESRSICCLWRINLHGKERKRF